MSKLTLSYRVLTVQLPVVWSYAVHDAFGVRELERLAYRCRVFHCCNKHICFAPEFFERLARARRRIAYAVMLACSVAPIALVRR